MHDRPLTAPKTLLDEVRFREYFKAIITNEDIQNPKPAPDTFLKAAEKLKIY